MHSQLGVSWLISLPDMAEAAEDFLLSFLSLRCCSTLHALLIVIVQQLSVVFNCDEDLCCHNIPDGNSRYW